MKQRSIQCLAGGILALLTACGGGSGMVEQGTQQPITKPSGVAAPAIAARPTRLFITGHSLTDQPLPDDLAAIAASLGTPLQWNRQYKVGSSIESRTRGETEDGAASRATWGGYRTGSNREGEGLNVLEELRQPRTVSGGPYDTLLITERHDLLGSLVWHDTVRHLRHFHDRLIDGNPQGQTYFYESWLDLSDKNDPRRWIAYERAASPVWRCIVNRVNHSLAAEGRSDRIVSLPAGAALADLMERATQGPALPGISGSTPRETVDRLVRDTVHPTRMGMYYMALVSYAAIYRRSPVGAWAPDGIGVEAARSLQTVAWESISAYDKAERSQENLAACRQRVTAFIMPFWTYVRDLGLNQGQAPLKAYLDWGQRWVEWRYKLARDNASNPMHYDAATDKAHWLPAP